MARTLARTLGLDEDLAEAVALAHDLGHTPFGHTGEDALAACMAPHGGFDHNAQTLRIITSLERRYAAFDGLNLTWETLEGVAKHNGPLLPAPEAPRDALPLGVAEADAAFPLALHEHASAEAQVAAIADDIAYNNHDIDDGLRAGLFTAEEARTLPLIGRAFDEVEAAWPGLEPGRAQSEALRRVFGVMVEDVLAESRRRLDAARPESAAAVRALGAPVIAFSEDMRAQIGAIRAFLFRRMYRHWRVARMRAKAARVVEELFEAFHAAPMLMPPEWGEAAAAETGGARARIVADYIAGMTDRFALEEHAKLTDPLARA